MWSGLRLKEPGISLIEVMLIIVLLSATILPFTIMMSQAGQLARGGYIISTRNLFLQNANDAMASMRSDYYTQFNDSAKNTTALSESGQKLPYRVSVDLANSDIFSRMSYLYMYNDENDADSSPRSRLLLLTSGDTFRMRCGNSAPMVDSNGDEWVGETAYNAATKQPGYTTGSTGSESNNTYLNQLSVDSRDRDLFKYWRTGSAGVAVEYKFDVPNGDYTVQLYFAEMQSTGVTSRYMNIYLEDMATPVNPTQYCPYVQAGNYNRGVATSYDVTVADKVLDLKVALASGTAYPRISGIVIKKRLVQ